MFENDLRVIVKAKELAIHSFKLNLTKKYRM